jgi:hypothetical protein
MPLKLYTTVVCCLFSLQFGVGQEIRTNSEGEKIIVYPDGRIEYFNGEPVTRDSLLGPTDAPLYPVFKGYIEPLDGEIQPNEADLFKIAQRRAQLSTAAAQIAENRLEQALENLQQTEARLAAISPSAEEYPVLQRQAEAARSALAQSRQEAQEADQLANTTEQLVSKGGFVEAFNARQRAYQDAENRSRKLRLAADQNYAAVLPLVENFVASTRRDLLRFPPSRVCKFSYEGEDEDRQAFRRDTEPELIFTYTDERLRPYLKEKEYLRCEAALTSVGGYRYLQLEFTFAYPNAREAYGFIDRNSVLTLKLLNGDFVNLRAGKLARGQYNTVKQELRYQVQYPIDRGLISMLKGSELDLVRVWWSSGYEEYPIQQLDFFQRAFRCLGD